jgi:hypothetical protein
MIVQSTPDYTGAAVSILGDNIIIRVPFNKKFINEFRIIKNNTFQWNKEDRVYKSRFSTEALKIATTQLFSYFSTVLFCENIQAILSQLAYYKSATFWNPTLVKVHDRLLIAASNPVLDECISGIELKMDASTFYMLSKYGVRIDPALIKDDATLEFAANPVVSADIRDSDQTARLIREIGCTHAIMGRGMRFNPVKNAISKALTAHGITTISINSLYNYSEINDASSDVVLLQQNSRSPFIHPSVNKIIIIKDSTPVEVK